MDTQTLVEHEVPPAQRARPSFLTGVVVGVLITAVVIGTGVLISDKASDRFPSPKPLGTKVFQRTTHEGMKVVAFESDSDSTPFSDCSSRDCPPCAVAVDLAATFDGRWEGGTASFASASMPIVDLNGPSGFGGPGVPTISMAEVHVAAEVARVRARWSGGATDEMAPVRGFAVLAAYGLAGDVVVDAFDAAGVVIGTNAGSRTPEPCDITS